jgi:hypothetical protein
VLVPAAVARVIARAAFLVATAGAVKGTAIVVVPLIATLTTRVIQPTCPCLVLNCKFTRIMQRRLVSVRSTTRRWFPFQKYSHLLKSNVQALQRNAIQGAQCIFHALIVLQKRSVPKVEHRTAAPPIPKGHTANSITPI